MLTKIEQTLLLIRDSFQGQVHWRNCKRLIFNYNSTGTQTHVILREAFAVRCYLQIPLKQNNSLIIPPAARRLTLALSYDIDLITLLII